VDTNRSRAVLHFFYRYFKSIFKKASPENFDDSEKFIVSRNNIVWDEPSLFFLRAMFRENTRLDSVFTHNSSLISVRQSNSNRENKDPYLNSSLNFDNLSSVQTADLLPLGELTGVKNDLRNIQYNSEPGGTHQLNINRGGGLLGSFAFLYSMDERGKKADGGIGLGRTFIKDKYEQLFCRSQPVIRVEDAHPGVKPNSGIPFNQNAACMGCHYAMDYGAAAFRNYYPEERKANHIPAIIPSQYDSSLQEIMELPENSDPDFYKRAAYGTLRIRSAIDGSFIEQNVLGIDGFGQAIAQNQDFYLCQTYRMFNLLTGYELKFYDPSNIPQGFSYSTEEQEILVELKALSLDLMNDQSLLNLVEKIVTGKYF
jgi:hypothetical protein